MSAVQRIEIDYAPRRWAKLLHESFKRWAVLVLHRRAGKTTAILNHHQRAATNNAWELARLRHLLPGKDDKHLKPLLKRREYWHVMPTLQQARRTAWDMLRDFARPIPGVKTNSSEMSVTYPNGNKLRLIGADDPDSLRGPALSGVSLDEYSDINQRAFGEVLSKALGDHVGYAIFCGTIKGKDQLYDTYQAAKDNADWYAVWQDVDTSLATESGPTITALTRAMEDERKLVLQGIMTQAEFDQEWFLSPEAAIKGAIYGNEIQAARREGRIGRVPFDPVLPVDTDWDLGYGDSTVVWFSQSLRTGEVRLIDYYEASGEGFQHYAGVLKEKAKAHGYIYGVHWAPHDIAVHELGTGKSRLDTAKEHGISFQITPRMSGTTKGEVEEGINAVRLLLPRCWFDETKCERGLEALTHYKRGYNKQLDEFKPEPVHDWASHGADAFRGLAVRHQVPRIKDRAKTLPMPQQWGWS